MLVRSSHDHRNLQQYTNGPPRGHRRDQHQKAACKPPCSGLPSSPGPWQCGCCGPPHPGSSRCSGGPLRSQRRREPASRGTTAGRGSGDGGPVTTGRLDGGDIGHPPQQQQPPPRPRHQPVSPLAEGEGALKDTTQNTRSGLHAAEKLTNCLL